MLMDAAFSARAKQAHQAIDQVSAALVGPQDSMSFPGLPFLPGRVAYRDSWFDRTRNLRRPEPSLFGQQRSVSNRACRRFDCIWGDARSSWCAKSLPLMGELRLSRKLTFW